MSVEGDDVWRPVCSVDRLRAAGRMEVLIERLAVLLLWQGGVPQACAALCPHAFAPLIDGTIADGRIHCSRHQASFSLTDGAPDPGWRTPPLRLYRTRTRDDQVEILCGGNSQREMS